MGVWLRDMAARFSLPSLRGVSRARWAAVALTTGAAGYVGVVTHRWRRRYREYSYRESVKWSPAALFSSGVALGVVAMATGPALKRWGSPRPDRVFVSVLPILRANNEVRDLVGSTLKPGLFKAYAYGGGVRWNGVNWGGVKLSGVDRSIRQLVTFHPYTLQLLFQVHGQLSSAMVSLVVRKHTLWRSGLLYESLVVDLPNGERLVLKGSPLANVLERYTARLT